MRYLAPECLEGTVDVACIDALRRCDVYAFALVVWECVSRLESAQIGELCAEYAPPFFEHVRGNPSVGEMRRITLLREELWIGALNQIRESGWADSALNVRLDLVRVSLFRHRRG